MHVGGSEDGEGGSIGKGSMRGHGPPLPHNSPYGYRAGPHFSHSNSMRRDSVYRCDAAPSPCSFPNSFSGTLQPSALLQTLPAAHACKRCERLSDNG